MAELTKALVKVQGVLEPARPNKQNPHLKNKYADLEAVWGVCRKPLAENGLAVLHTFSQADGAVTVRATLVHESGEFISTSITLTPVKPGPQEVGSTITYGRRYTLASLVGIVVDDDDDGNAASGTGPKAGTQPDELATKKDTIRKKLQAYKGDNRQEIVDECAALQAQNSWTHKYADAILAKLAGQPVAQ